MLAIELKRRVSTLKAITLVIDRSQGPMLVVDAYNLNQRSWWACNVSGPIARTPQPTA